MENYNHNEIEQKWQKFWLKNKTFKAKTPSSVPHDKRARGFEKKFYALDMFPYPSGAGLHVGHPLGMTATDIISRKKRHEGFNVLHPMGWDAFGLPAENYAIKTGVHPQVSTQENIANFRRQIQSLGFSYDWDREIDTTDPNYYKWSQWIFLQLYKKGLAYESDKAMNWCPKCKIVAANEEVEQGMHERCGSPVEKKKLKQWMFRITDYAERLLADLNTPTVHIFHGWGANNKSNWFENSRDFLVKNKVNCQVLDFPNTEAPKYEEWKNHFEKNTKKVWAQDIFVGHSLGGGFIQKYLSENDAKLDQLILVAPTVGDCGIEEIKDFFSRDFDYEKIKKSARKITIICSDNDEYIKLKEFKFLAKKLAAELIILPGRGHLNEPNFPEFREILDSIQKSVLDWPDKIKAMQRNWIGKSEGAEVEFAVEKLNKNLNKEKRGCIPCGGHTKGDTATPSLFNLIINGELVEVNKKGTKKRKLLKELKVVTKLPNNKEIIFDGEILWSHFLMKSLRESRSRQNWALTIIKSLEKINFENNIGHFICRDKVFRVILSKISRDLFQVKTFYEVSSLTKLLLANKLEKITVYTTRPDTLFGATYFVLAPEHELVDKITTPEFREKIESYKNECANKSELERTELNKEKTGQFTGAYVKNPINGKLLPVWIADYVMTGYGTGAIMAVPAHDERDFEFAEKYDLPIIKVVDLEDPFQKSGGKMINSDFLNGLSVEEAVKKMTEFLEDKKIGKKKINYKLRDWIFTRQRYWGEPIPLIHCEKCGVIPHDPNFAKYSQTWKNICQKDTKKEGCIVGCSKGNTANPSFSPTILSSRAIYVKFFRPKKKFLEQKEETIATKLGKIQFSGQNLADHFNNKSVQERRKRKRLCHTVIKALPLISEWFKNKKELIGYFQTKQSVVRVVLAKDKKGRFFVKTYYFQQKISNAWKNLVKNYSLPLVLPETAKYEPSENGESPLAKIKDWVKTKCPCCAKNAQRETSTMPNWAGSSWYWLRYMDPQNSAKFCDKEIEKYWGPVDLYVGGAEHAVLHLLYSRFWQKVLYDLNLVSTKEPFKKLVNQGLIMGEDGNKMSKSLGNVVNPDEIVEKYGADTFRMYEMFMGPFDQSKPWASSAVGGMRRFLDRVWRIAQKPIFDLDTPDGLCKIHGPELHKTIKIVGEHIDEFKFNTAISQMMVMVNMLTPLDKIPREILKQFTILLSPFAPHLAEEIWQEVLGNKESISTAQWPEYDEKLLIQDEVTYAVQVNGKLRGNFKISKDANKDEAINTAKSIEKVAKYLSEGEIKKEIFVPGKIVGFVVK